MLYKLAHLIKEHCAPLWGLACWFNAVLFRLRYGRRLAFVADVVAAHGFRLATPADAEELVAFFAAQPQDAFKYFHPHGYTQSDLQELLASPTWIVFLAEDDEGVTGYAFLQAFFMGKSYLGKMVDHGHQGRGIGQKMCQAAMEVATLLHLRMFESISRDNLPSLRSSQKVLRTEVVAELPDNYLLIEDFPK